MTGWRFAGGGPGSLRTRWLAVAVLAALAAPAAPARAQLACAPCVVGVVFDSPWERNDELLATFEREIRALAAPQFEVALPGAKRRVADATPDGVRGAVDALLADSEVDLVLAAGPIAAASTGQRASLPKPVISAFVFDPPLQGLPVATSAAGERVSGRPNLSYVTLPNDLTEELHQLHRVTPFAQLAVLVGAPLLDAVPGYDGLLRSALAQSGPPGTVGRIVRVGDSASETLASIPAGIEAVYVMPLMHLPPGEFDRLARGLVRRRLPTFSYLGRREVDAGLLMSLYPDNDFPRLGRRIAVHVQRLLRGEEAGALPVDFRRDRRLTLNMATARAVGIDPDWRLLTEADLLHDAPPAAARRLSLAAAVREAVAANLDLAADDRLVAAGRQIVRGTRAAHRPRIALSAATRQINLDRARGSFGFVPAWTGAGTVGVSQVLYSDAVSANVEIEEHRQAGREHSRAERRLDVVHAAAAAYLNVLRAAAIERVQRENLTVTRSNLDLAQSRQRIGVARASEVIRWENQIAVNRRAVIETGAGRRIAEMALNRLLHRPLEERFGTVEAGLDDPGLLRTATLEAHFGRASAFSRFRDFLTQEALAAAPELRQLDAAMAAAERAALAARRALRRPQVEARGDVTAIGAFEMGSLPMQPPLPDRLAGYLDWTAGVSASLPLFEGGARRAARTRADRELEEWRLRRRAAAERIEERIRSAAHLAGASFAGIELADAASDAARRNLDLVTDAYEQGVVQILDLLDAQQAALLAELEAANAVYDHLIDQMAVQRALGRFRFFMSPEESAAFGARLRDHFEAAGGMPNGRP